MANSIELKRTTEHHESAQVFVTPVMANTLNELVFLASGKKIGDGAETSGQGG